MSEEMSLWGTARGYIFGYQRDKELLTVSFIYEKGIIHFLECADMSVYPYKEIKLPEEEKEKLIKNARLRIVTGGVKNGRI